MLCTSCYRPPSQSGRTVTGGGRDMLHALLTLLKDELESRLPLEADAEQALSPTAIVDQMVAIGDDGAALAYSVDIVLEESQRRVDDGDTVGGLALLEGAIAASVANGTDGERVQRRRLLLSAASLRAQHNDVLGARTTIDRVLSETRERIAEPNRAFAIPYDLSAAIAETSGDAKLARIHREAAARCRQEHTGARMGGHYGSTTTEINVSFCTSRRRVGSSNSALSNQFTFRGASTPTFGRALYRTRSYPEIDADIDVLLKRAETSWFWQKDREDVGMVLDRKVNAQESEFWQDFPIKEAPEASEVVYIHGFWNSFETAIRGAAEVAAAVGRRNIFMYSWPSVASAAGYERDRDGFSVTFAHHLSSFIGAIAARAPTKPLVIVAHSMGARYTIAALNVFARSNPPLGAPVRLILAAPDVSPDLFELEWGQFGGVLERCTIYRSMGDRALWLSEGKNGQNRLGRGGLTEALDRVEVIDTNKGRWAKIGHNDFIENAVDDLRGEVWLGLRASTRRTVSLQESGEYLLHDDKKNWVQNVRAFAAAMTLMNAWNPNVKSRLLLLSAEATKRIEERQHTPDDLGRLAFLKEVLVHVEELEAHMPVAAAKSPPPAKNETTNSGGIWKSFFGRRSAQ